MAPYEAMVHRMAAWMGVRADEDAIDRAVYEAVDDATVSIDWTSHPAQVVFHTTAGENETEIRTRPLKWPFTEEQLERAMHWLIRQAIKLNARELDNQRH